MNSVPVNQSADGLEIRGTKWHPESRSTPFQPRQQTTRVLNQDHRLGLLQQTRVMLMGKLSVAFALRGAKVL